MRIKRLETHLKAFMGRYKCEPKTLDHFLLRESLMHQMESLENKLRRVGEKLNRRELSMMGLGAEINALAHEFRELDRRVRAYAGS